VITAAVQAAATLAAGALMLPGHRML
jgi:hypothetical protein